MCLHIDARGQPLVVLGIIYLGFFLSLTGACSSRIRFDWLLCESQESICLCILSVGITSTCLPAQIFPWIMGVEFKCSYLCSKHLSNWALSLASGNTFLSNNSELGNIRHQKQKFCFVWRQGLVIFCRVASHSRSSCLSPLCQDQEYGSTDSLEAKVLAGSYNNLQKLCTNNSIVNLSIQELSTICCYDSVRQVQNLYYISPYHLFPWGVGEMVHGFRALIVITEGWGLVPSIPKAPHSHCNSGSRGSNAVSLLVSVGSAHM